MRDPDPELSPLLQRKKSFLDQPIGLFRGPNTLHNFASSFTRAQSYAAEKIDPAITHKRSFFAGNRTGDATDELYDPDLMVPLAHGKRLSSLVGDHSTHLAGYSAVPDNEVFHQDEISHMLSYGRSRRNSNIGDIGSLGSATVATGATRRKISPSLSFLSLRLNLTYASTSSAFTLRKIEDGDGNVLTVVAGQSTVPQTTFNSVNVLIGVGLLAVPVGLLRAGWVLGVPLLVACCLTTYWSARLLSRALDTDATLMTYADLGYASYGAAAKLLISLFFIVDLLALGVSLVLLLSDLLYALLGAQVGWSKTHFKLLAFVVLTPFNFVPLPALSMFLLFGIMSTISITLLVLACGLWKSTAPGSLLQAMPTNLYPQSAADFFTGLGILMAPFGAHAIFPSLKSDMRHRHKFTHTLMYTYSVTLVTDCAMAVVGFFMFGALCNNEVTSLVLETPGYPVWIYPLISGLICVVPLAKTPLNAKPIISSLDSVLGIDSRKDAAGGLSVRRAARVSTRVGVNALFVALSVAFPDFDKIIGILGSSICFVICIILPCLFYLKLCGKHVGGFERACVWVVIVVSFILAVVCTAVTIMY